MHFPPLTKKLLWLVVAMLVLPLLIPRELQVHLMLWPLGEIQYGTDSFGMPATIGFMPWQLLTHVIFNPGVGGILFVALTLVFFGSTLEQVWGERRYGLFLLTVTVGGGLFQLLLLTVGTRMGLIPFLPVAGASAVMYGVLFAVAYLDPHRRVMLIIPPIPMKMWVLVAVLCAIELAVGMFGSPNGLAHFGFLGGMLAAWLHIRYWRGEPPFKPRRPPGPRLVR